MGEYTWQEFKQGSEKLKCDSIESWKQAVPRLRSELVNEGTFAEMYKYAF